MTDNQTADSDRKTGRSSGDNNYPIATFAAGCFWAVEYAFSQIPGVKATCAGFMGGTVDNPSYRRVCRGDTNHAEVVQLRYNPQEVTYETLVKFFFLSHDPTTLNRQGPDTGTQYRSAIFYHSREQKEIADKVKNRYTASGRFKKSIVTEITPAATFWKAEEYHQDYARKNPGSCHTVDVKAILSEIAADSF
ncbi:MAG: peptide-methionine (S)-S-oxide reductase MsrA [Phycisphaerae bacterium]|nr:peptide-methionine (S)-S-oxide reductase MsrA [Phycisphaerae bacterium]